MILKANGAMKHGRDCVSQSMQAIQSVISGISSGTPQIWTNMPAALTEPILPPQNVLRRGIADFRDADFGFIRVGCVTAGATNAEVAVQYSTNGGGAWNTWLLADGTTEAWAPLDASTVTYYEFPIPDATKIQDLILRIVGRNGDATADPSFEVILGAVNMARDLTSATWSGDRPPCWKSLSTHKRPFWRGHAVTILNGIWTNMPSALTAVPNPPMTSNPIPTGFIDNLIAAHAGYIRHYCNVGVVGASGAVLLLQYSSNSGSSWQFIDFETGNTGAPIAINTANLRYSSFVKIDEAFLFGDPATRQIRLVGQNGNGAIDPSFVLYGAETTHYDPAQY